MANHRVVKKPLPAPNFKGLLLVLFGMALLPTAVVSLLSGKLGTLLISIIAFLLLIGASWLTRRGIDQQLDYQKSHIAAHPRPLKKSAMVAAALAAWLITAGLNDYGFFMGLVFALFAALGYYLFYGLDPAGEKISERLGGYSTEELVEIIREAETKIMDIEHQRIKLGEGELNERLGRITLVARDVLGTLEQKPRELRNARRFLNVYLDGAQRVVADYARVHDKTDATFLDKNFREVLVTIEDTFMSQRGKLLANDVLDLDIQIEVLKKQLQEDGNNM